MKRTPPTANNRKSRQPAKASRKRRPASKLTVMILAVLAIALSIQIIRMNGQIRAAQKEEAVVAQRLAEIQEVNRQLQDDLDNSSDPALIESIARDQLGMVREGEKVFHISK